MPKATVTVREVHNKDSGVDLRVTSFKELPGLMRSTYEYQIVVVSNLSCFKLPSHKDTDVVQFTLYRKWNDFEDLRAKLNEAFSGTVFPPIVKKSIIVNEAVIKERRNNLDGFLKFLAATPRIVTASPVLVFLGVEAGRAKRFADGVEEGAQDNGRQESNEGETTQEEDGQETGARSGGNLFEEDEEEVDDILGDDDEDDDGYFDDSSPATAATGASMFEEQDLKRELTEEDEKDFGFIPDAIITTRQVVTETNTAGEDDDSNNDLLNVDEDIDMDSFMALTVESKAKTSPPPTPSTTRTPTTPTTATPA